MGSDFAKNEAYGFRADIVVQLGFYCFRNAAVASSDLASLEYVAT
jgi:hypothetical protein